MFFWFSLSLFFLCWACSVRVERKVPYQDAWCGIATQGFHPYIPGERRKISIPPFFFLKKKDYLKFLYQYFYVKMILNRLYLLIHLEFNVNRIILNCKFGIRFSNTAVKVLKVYDQTVLAEFHRFLQKILHNLRKEQKKQKQQTPNTNYVAEITT